MSENYSFNRNREVNNRFGAQKHAQKPLSHYIDQAQAKGREVNKYNAEEPKKRASLDDIGDYHRF